MDMSTNRKFAIGFLAVVCVLVGRYSGGIPVSPPPIPIPAVVVVTDPPTPAVVPVVPPTPVVPTPIPSPPCPPSPPIPVPVVDPISSEIGELDSDFVQSEAQKATALARLNKYKTLIEGIETKHGLLPTPVVPTPSPIPPTPAPIVPVVPTPAPITAPTGFRVIFVQNADTPLTPAQTMIFDSANATTYLNQKCAKSTAGLAEWRRWRSDVSFGKTTQESPTMVALWNAIQPQLALLGAGPQVVIAVNGKAQIFPQPTTDADLMTLLKSFGGN